MTRKILSCLIVIAIMISSMAPISAQNTGIFQLINATLTPNQHDALEEGSRVISALVTASGSVSSNGEPPYIEVSVINNTDKKVVEGVTMVPQKPYLIGNTAQFTMLLPTKMLAAQYTVEMRAIQGGMLLSKTTATYTVYSDEMQNTPTIKSVSINPPSHMEGTIGQVNGYVDVSTTNIPVGTPIQAGLIDNLGNEVTSIYGGIVSDNHAAIVISIPAAIKAGQYDVKVTTLELVDTSAKYEVSGVASQKTTISSINTTNATLLQGNIQGSMQIIGSNFSTVSSENNVVIYGTDNNFTSPPMTLQNVTKTTLTVALPKDLIAGHYGVKVSTNGQTAVLQEGFLIDSNLFAIENMQIQTGANMVEGDVEGTIALNVINLPSTTYFVYATDLYGNVVAALEDLGYSNGKITVKLPNTLKSGEYRIRITSAGKSVDSSYSFIIKSIPLIVPEEPENLIEIPVSVLPSINSQNDTALVILNSELISGYVKQSVVGTSKENTFFSVNISENLGMKQEILLEEATILQLAENNIGLKIGIGNLSVRLPEELMDYTKELPFKLVVSPLSDTQEENLLYLTKKMTTSKMIASSDIKDIQLIKLNGTEEEKMNFEDYNIQLEFTISDEILATVDERKLGIYTLDEDTMLWNYVGGTYNPEDKTIYADVSHFSKYMVMEKTRSFSDVATLFWGRDAIEVLAAKNIVNGVDDIRFLPNKNMTRAEFATIIVKAFNLETTPYEGDFTDVKKTDWYFEYVEAVYDAGIMLGKGNGRFAPLEPISRQEVAIILTRVYKNVKGITGTVTDTSGVVYKDLSTSATWAETAIIEAKHYKLMSGNGNNLFLPQSFSTRAENATGVYNLLKAIEN